MASVETCPLCGLDGIAGKRGLTAHVRLKHPDKYVDWRESPPSLGGHTRKKTKKKVAKKPQSKGPIAAQAAQSEEATCTASEDDPQAEDQAEQEIPPVLIYAPNEEDLFELLLG